MKAFPIRTTAFELETAARHLGITRIALTTELRERGILANTDGHGLVPTPAHQKTGNFLTEPRRVDRTGQRTRHYVVTLVTVQGLAWLASELKRAA